MSHQPYRRVGILGFDAEAKRCDLRRIVEREARRGGSVLNRRHLSRYRENRQQRVREESPAE